jgi:hypothetical protein
VGVLEIGIIDCVKVGLRARSERTEIEGTASMGTLRDRWDTGSHLGRGVITPHLLLSRVALFIAHS